MRGAKKADLITIRVDAETKARLEALAVADDRTLSAYIGRLLRDHLKLPKPTKPKAGGKVK